MRPADLDTYIDGLVDQWPPLTEQQIFRVQSLLVAPNLGGD